MEHDHDEGLSCASEMHVPPTQPLPEPTVAEQQREERRRASGLMNSTFDSHIHLFPQQIFESMWRWFDAHAWQIAFRGTAEETVQHLHEHGIQQMAALVFAHKPGVARWLNRFLADQVRAQTGIVGVGTVMPSEPEAPEIVREAIVGLGLKGIKLHCHVQRLAIDDPRVLEVLGICQDLQVPAVVHAGREPASQAYGIDCHTICGVQRTRRVLELLPELKLVIPHVGADEYDQYLNLTREFPNLWLDTAMACAQYFELSPEWSQLEACADRVLFGTDFPIVPYAIGREATVLARKIQDDAAFAKIMRENALKLWQP